MANDINENPAPTQQQIDQATGVENNPLSRVTTEGYILEEDVKATNEAGNIVVLPARTRVRM